MKSTFFISRKKRKFAQNHLNLVPFIDVLLILVVLLMSAVSTFEHAVRVNLPSGLGQFEQAQFTEQPLLLTVSKDKILYLEHPLLEKEPLTPSALVRRLKACAQENLTDTLFVLADKTAPYQDVIDTLSLAHQAGFSQVTLVTDQEEQRA